MPNVNDGPRQNKTPDQICRSAGIQLKSYKTGQHSTTCPQCSADRTKKRAECLSVKIDPDGVVWHCNHCGWKGGGSCQPHFGNNQDKPTYYYGPTIRKVKLGKDYKIPFVWEHKKDGNWEKGAGPHRDYLRDAIFQPDMIKSAISVDKWVGTCEGEKDAQTGTKLKIPLTCNAHGAGKWTNGCSQHFVGAKVAVFGDNDLPGEEHAQQTAKSLNSCAKKVIRIDLKKYWPDIPAGGDLTAFVENGGDLVAVFKKETEAADAVSGVSGSAHARTGNGHTTLSDAEIAEMAKMGAIALDQKIKELASAHGVSQASVRSEYKARAIDTGAIQKGPAVDEPEPWPDAFDPAKLLDWIAKDAKSHVVLPPHADTIATLYATYSYLPEIYKNAPRLEITAPQKRCGKTTLLKFLYHICYRRVAASNITPASLFRLIHAKHPTLLIDEVNQFAGKDQDFKAVLNDGYDRMFAYVWRCNVNTLDPEPYYCFGPLIYCHTGDLDKELYDSMVDRSIAIHLARRTREEAFEEMDEVGDHDEYIEVRRKLRRFAIDNEDKIKEAVRTIKLDGVGDRLLDTWRPLLAIAKVVGGGWFNRALNAITAPDEEGSLDEMLLDDIKDIRAKLVGEYGYSNGVVERLNQMEDRPWSEIGGPGKPMTMNKLARMLKPYGIRPRLDPTRNGRVYYWKDFEPVWKRYTGRDTRSVVFPENNCPTVQPIDSSRAVDGQLEDDFSQLSPEQDTDPDDWQFNQ